MIRSRLVASRSKFSGKPMPSVPKLEGTIMPLGLKFLIAGLATSHLDDAEQVAVRVREDDEVLAWLRGTMERCPETE